MSQSKNTQFNQDSDVRYSKNWLAYRLYKDSRLHPQYNSLYYYLQPNIVDTESALNGRLPTKMNSSVLSKYSRSVNTGDMSLGHNLPHNNGQ
jgi:hypothetical protein